MRIGIALTVAGCVNSQEVLTEKNEDQRMDFFMKNKAFDQELEELKQIAADIKKQKAQIDVPKALPTVPEEKVIETFDKNSSLIDREAKVQVGKDSASEKGGEAEESEASSKSGDSSAGSSSVSAQEEAEERADIEEIQRDIEAKQNIEYGQKNKMFGHKDEIPDWVTELEKKKAAPVKENIEYGQKNKMFGHRDEIPDWVTELEKMKKENIEYGQKNRMFGHKDEIPEWVTELEKMKAEAGKDNIDYGQKNKMFGHRDEIPDWITEHEKKAKGGKKKHGKIAESIRQHFFRWMKKKGHSAEIDVVIAPPRNQFGPPLPPFMDERLMDLVKPENQVPQTPGFNKKAQKEHQPASFVSRKEQKHAQKMARKEAKRQRKELKRQTKQAKKQSKYGRRHQGKKHAKGQKMHEADVYAQYDNGADFVKSMDLSETAIVNKFVELKKLLADRKAIGPQ